MKKTIYFFTLCMGCSLMLSAQEGKLTKDEAAIKAVIESESEYFWGRDFDKWAALYVHAPYVVWTASSKNGVRTYQGWESWKKEVKSLFESDPDPKPYEGVVTKYNYRFRIYKDGAWVSFDQMDNGTKTLETRIMEKENGKWKIAMVQVIYNANEPLGLGDDDSTGE